MKRAVEEAEGEMVLPESGSGRGQFKYVFTDFFFSAFYWGLFFYMVLSIFGSIDMRNMNQKKFDVKKAEEID